MTHTEQRDPRASSARTELWRIVRPFFWMTFAATLIGVVGGLTTAWLLALINRGFHSAEAAGGNFLLQFAGLCCLGIAAGGVAGVANSVVGQRMIASLRKDISRRVTQASIETIEEYKSARLLTILSSDVDTVSAFTFNFSGYVMAMTIVIGSLVYLLTLSILVFSVFILAIGIAAGLTAYSKIGWLKDYNGVRDAEDQLQQQFRAITDGAKEIRLNTQRERQVHDVLLAGAVDSIASLKISAMKRFWVVGSVSSGIIFIAIGVLLALRSSGALQASTTSGAILVMLYIRGPIEQLLSGLPAFFQAQISFRRIAELSHGLAGAHDGLNDGEPAFGDFSELRLRGVGYAFAGRDGRPGFELAPIDLTIHSGEILFIVGENGSGKTTLVKLLLGLYGPQSGRIEIDGVEVSPRNLVDYRQLFSAVFSDYFLFADLLDLDENLVAQAEAYLEDLEIAHKVDIRDASFSTIDLSTGQRKRLALIHAYLERRPIMMFDEWAADQDPTFRRTFYERILPDLKAQGKTLIVVSHDDRFFHVADRIITLDKGSMVEGQAPTAECMVHASADLLP